MALRLSRRWLASKPLLVVALEQALAAPICTSRLADGGARVIKIERPEGDFARHYDRMVVRRLRLVARWQRWRGG